MMLLVLPIGMLAVGTTWQTATLISSGDTSSGTMDADDADHWYKIEVPAEGAVTFDVKTDANLVMRYVELHAKSSNDNLASWGWEYLYDGDHPYTVSGLKAGTYYVHLQRQDKSGGYTMTYTFTPNSYANDPEPNDEWKQASLLVSGKTVEGHLGYNYWNNVDNDDWYKIEVPAEGDVTFDIKSDANLIVRYVELFAKSSNDNLASWGWEYMYDGDHPHTFTGLKAGTYYVNVQRQDSHGGYTMTYTFKPNTYANDPEPNDEWKQASLLVSGKTVEGHLGYNYWSNVDNDDWYKIEVPADGDVTFDVKTDASLIVRYVELFALTTTNDLGSWGWEYMYDGAHPYTVTGLKAGTYYVNVQRQDSHGGYTMNYTFKPNSYPNDQEPNDDWKSAATLTKDKTVSGHLGYNYRDNMDNDDWYKITLSQAGKVEINLSTDAASNLVVKYVEFYKSSGNDVSSIKWEYQYEKFQPLVVENLEAGTYYVRVCRNDGHGAYFLVWGAKLSPVEPTYGGNCLIVWLSETNKHYYDLNEKPKVTMSKGVFTVKTTSTTATYKFDDVMKFTLGEGGTTGIEEVKAAAGPMVSRQADRLFISGSAPKSAIRIYTQGGRLADTQWTDSNGRAEISLSGLAAGVYIVKTDSITIKIAKR